MNAYGEEVTVERISAAFKKSQLQMLFGRWWQRFKRGGGGCCALGVLVVDKTGSTTVIEKAQKQSQSIAIQIVAKEIGESFDTVSSFVAGFDNLCAFLDQPPPKDKEAYNLGCAVREANY